MKPNSTASYDVLDSQQQQRPSLVNAESKRNILDEGLHASVHDKVNKRYSFKMEDSAAAAANSILAVSSEDDDSLDDKDDDYGANASSDSFCEASQNSQANQCYLRQSVSFDGDLIDFIELHRQEITDGVDIDDDDEDDEPDDMVATTESTTANFNAQQVQEEYFEDDSDDALQLEINRVVKEEEENVRRQEAKPQVE
ncbi:hypothetical protein MPSEU_000620500 [Mayamaea pseudoterrestris]|nr:hypothetical protein MPSEU_000620500 [Mayamaea pseudoterrestris]